MKSIAILAASVLLLTGCSAPAPTDHHIMIVTSTDVYASIAQAIGGSLVTVTSIINDPAQDPHSFEANARVQFQLSRADIVIENGAGYDDFVDTMLRGLDNHSATVLNVATLSGKTITSDFNEHLWYDFPTIERLVIHLVNTLAAASPAGANTFQTNAQNFAVRLAGLEARTASLKQRSDGKPVAMTEPIAGYLLAASGLKVVSPPEFSAAIEQGTDIAPAVLNETIALFVQRKVALMVYNSQTPSPQLQAVLLAAHTNTIPVIAVTETLPPGFDYLRWMGGNVSALERALR